jgi:hydrogenase nickel incorporation protein HypA/HybF
MHELGYGHSVLHAVEQRAAGRPVARIGVRVGSLHRIVPAAFEQSFQLVAAGGVADGATTAVTVVPAQGSCADCGNGFETFESAAACPDCGSIDVQLAGGDELVLEWIEYRDPAATGDPAGSGARASRVEA